MDRLTLFLRPFSCSNSNSVGQMTWQVYSEYYCGYFQFIAVVCTCKETQYLENSNESK